MMNYSLPTAQPEYDVQFWNMARGRIGGEEFLSKGYNVGVGTYTLPTAGEGRMTKAITKESLFRKLATVINAYGTEYTIFSKHTDDLAMFVEENGSIPVYEGINDFDISSINSHKLAAFLKLDTEFVYDAAFSIEDYLSARLGKNFGRAEDKAFVIGGGEKEPVGILHDEEGAEVGATADSLTYDDVIDLYFSVKPEFRRKGVWLMNDKTALALRKLKDADGNYLWNQSNDTILGKPVHISEFMPDATSGSKPVAFGDFSYYWVVLRSPVSLRTLTEKFAHHNQIGYLAIEFLDGKLVRKDAVKVLKLTDTQA